MKKIILALLRKVFLMFPKLKSFLFNNFYRAAATNLNAQKNIIKGQDDFNVSISYKLLTQLTKKVVREEGESFDVCVYFFGTMSEVYQLKQWFNVFDKMSSELSFCILVRSLKVYEFMLNEKFDVRYAHSIDDLDYFYSLNDIKTILYVNNGVKNFQSLISNKSIHIHINHGESEKTCMHSNQSKAYDYVFCVGKAGKDRYMKKLLKFDEEKYITVGRPQLDFLIPSEIKFPNNKNIILYAPTWAATHSSMNFSSIADYGIKIVKNLLQNESNYILYKPHPSTGRTCKREKSAHNEILALIDQHKNIDDFSNEEILGLLPNVDVGIFDNTSVAIDFMSFNKPMLITDYFEKEVDRPDFVKGAYLLKDDDYESIDDLVQKLIIDDFTKDKRNTIRNYYLGNFTKGESTKMFISEIKKIVQERDKGIEFLKY